MTKDTILAALAAEGLATGAETISIGEEREATFLVTTPGDVMPITRVVRVELRDRHLSLQTAKDERFWLTYEVILGIRFILAKPSKDRVAGFAK